MSEIPLFIWCLSGKAEEKMKTKKSPPLIGKFEKKEDFVMISTKLFVKIP